MSRVRCKVPFYLFTAQICSSPVFLWLVLQLSDWSAWLVLHPSYFWNPSSRVVFPSSRGTDLYWCAPTRSSWFARLTWSSRSAPVSSWFPASGSVSTGAVSGCPSPWRFLPFFRARSSVWFLPFLFFLRPQCCLVSAPTRVRRSATVLGSVFAQKAAGRFWVLQFVFRSAAGGFSVSPARAHFLLIVVLVVDCVRNLILFLNYWIKKFKFF
jgi:hypothetical protein